VLIAVSAVLDAGVPQKKPLPFCADAGHKAAPARLLPVDDVRRAIGSARLRRLNQDD